MSAVGGKRIVSLLPSATEIVGGLGLAAHLVGVTHECDVCPDSATLTKLLASGTCTRVTTSEINPHSMGQGEIDARVKVRGIGNRMCRLHISPCVDRYI